MPLNPTVPSSEEAAASPPRLLVFIVVDQLRADVLYRYEALFEGGLRRLLDDGLGFSAATHDHGVTETSPGHATLSTGTRPSRHGMVSNQWYERNGGAWMSVLNVEHEAYSLIGDSLMGGAAPERLMRSGIADWLVEAQPDARVVSLADKSRAAVLLAGQSRGDVYWFDEAAEAFTSSTYYSERLPRWIRDYNEQHIPDYLADTVWMSRVPAHAAGLTRPDTAMGEGDGTHTAFPHVAQLEGYDSLAGYWVGDTPLLDRSVLGLAREAVKERDLGSDDVPDYLALGLSSVDRVGHAYGPRSREQLDNLLRLDRELGEFLSFLDEEVGAGQYAVALTADHGVMDLPEASDAGRRLTVDDRRALEELLGRVVRAESANGDLAIATSLAAEAVDLPWIDAAWAVDAFDPANDSLAILQGNSMYPGRPTGVLARFGVVYRLAPETLDWNWPLGTHHGSPYYYDRHVPLLFMGSDVASGTRDHPVATVDVAPTLAAWLGIEAPEDLDGVALEIGTPGARPRE